VCVQGDASWGGNAGPVGTAATFIFKLGGDGAASERFDPSGANEQYQRADSSQWPKWGYSADLGMGDNGVLGANGYCYQDAYTAPSNQVCGGDSNWGATELVVFGRLPPPLPDPNTDAFLQAQPEISAHTWVTCFDSSVGDVSTPAVFHANCDEFAETVTVADNSLGFTFGGYVRELFFFIWFALSCPPRVDCFGEPCTVAHTTLLAIVWFAG
jgi:hypothetical protein